MEKEIAHRKFWAVEKLSKNLVEKFSSKNAKFWNKKSSFWGNMGATLIFRAPCRKSAVPVGQLPLAAPPIF